MARGTDKVGLGGEKRGLLPLDKEGICCSQQLRSEGWRQASWLPISVNMWALMLSLALADGFLRLPHRELQRLSEARQVGCECAGVLWIREGVELPRGEERSLGTLGISGLGRGCVPGDIGFLWLGGQSPWGAEGEVISSQVGRVGQATP